ncbi:MAG: hypothetical protein LBO69_00960 [Ignavibacteria bacterium]|jgi:hypothetical protein|nr:hypothetical protein [Ignavibacteria bacterium]
MKYTASRLTEGNKLFPTSISTEEKGLTIKFPGFLSGKETFVSYDDISGVTVDCPMVGYSKIGLNLKGDDISIHGFTKSDVYAIKAAIENGKV